nr:cytochrome P450 [Mycobacterium tilburgii]
MEKILRFESPVQMLVRSARRDTEIAGTRIRRGAMVGLLMGGANRDPRVFTDPDRFDITRPNARDHLAFGSGMHGCLGAALAGVEGAIALRTLFERFPDLSLSEQPERLGLVTLRLSATVLMTWASDIAWSTSAHSLLPTLIATLGIG